MPTVTGCPAPGRLVALLHGGLQAAEAKALAAHVESCPRCVAALRAVPTSDTAVPAMPAGDAADILRRLRSLVARQPDDGANRDTIPDLPARLGDYRVLKLVGVGGMGR